MVAFMMGFGAYHLLRNAHYIETARLYKTHIYKEKTGELPTPKSDMVSTRFKYIHENHRLKFFNWIDEYTDWIGKCYTEPKNTICRYYINVH